MTVHRPRSLLMRPLRFAAAIAALLAQSATAAYALVDRPVRDAIAHVEPAGVSQHPVHSESACAVCQALQHQATPAARGAAVAVAIRVQPPREELASGPRFAPLDNLPAPRPPPIG